MWHVSFLCCLCEILQGMKLCIVCVFVFSCTSKLAPTHLLVQVKGRGLIGYKFSLEIFLRQHCEMIIVVYYMQNYISVILYCIQKERD